MAFLPQDVRDDESFKNHFQKLQLLADHYGLATLAGQDENTLGAKLIPRTRLNVHLEGAWLRLRDLQRGIENLERIRPHPLIEQMHSLVITDSFLVVLTSPRTSPVVQGDVVHTLHDFLHDDPGKNLTEDQARWYFQQVALALDYSHRSEIAKMNLSTENCFLHRRNEDEEPVVVVSDWGKSIWRPNPAREQVFCPGYWPPEMVLEVEQGTYDAFKVDTYALGVVLYKLLYGKHSFPREVASDEEDWPTERLRSLAVSRMETELNWDSLPFRISPECWDVLRGLLDPNYVTRWSMTEVMNSQWFREHLPPRSEDMISRRTEGNITEEFSREVREFLEIGSQAPISRIQTFEF